MVEVFATKEAVLDAAAERFVLSSSESIRLSGRFAVALSGGSTPQGLYHRLAAEPFRTRVEWPRVHAFWGDERCVPPDDPASNYRMAWQALLEHVPIPSEHIHRIRGEAKPVPAAEEYERTLRQFFGAPEGPPAPRHGARFDLVLLGLGPDGHTASLFPGDPAVLEVERWVLAVEAPILPPRRVTLTPVVLRAARQVMFLVFGKEKAPALRHALAADIPAGRDPARAVLPSSGSVRWLVDRAAAASLPGGDPGSA